MSFGPPPPPPPGTGGAARRERIATAFAAHLVDPGLVTTYQEPHGGRAIADVLHCVPSLAVLLADRLIAELDK